MSRRSPAEVIGHPSQAGGDREEVKLRDLGIPR